MTIREQYMQTVVSRRGQTVIPAAIRKRYGIADGAQLVWLDDGRTIKVVPVSDDPIKADRKKDRDLERRR
jgi:AbrB family looped-hinge helix DNA binding protein